jgi:hypothetical protein
LLQHREQLSLTQLAQAVRLETAERKQAQAEQPHLQEQPQRLAASMQRLAKLVHLPQVFQMADVKIQTLWQPETLAVPDE